MSTMCPAVQRSAADRQSKARLIATDNHLSEAEKLKASRVGGVVPCEPLSKQEFVQEEFCLVARFV